MKKRKIIYGILGGLCVMAIILAAVISVQKSQSLKVVFFDVGQGDAILIEQGSKQILIDGGASGRMLLGKLGRYIPFWDREIEMIIATHPDQDHIGGLPDVLKSYRVGAVLETRAESDSQIFKNFRETIAAKNIPVVTAEKGSKITLPEGAQLEILHPDSSRPVDPRDTNANSIVARLSFGGNSFLLTGDLPSEQESTLIGGSTSLASRVLKVAHHGSKYSTSQEFLEAALPREAVISVGRSNRYGHPADEVLERLKAKNVEVLRTDELGDIRYECQSSQALCVRVAK
jgi:competence protein ComEC